MPPVRLESVFTPRSAVLVGASDVPGAVGTILLRNLRAAGFAGRLHLVNPKHDELHGEPVHRRVADLPEPVDVAVIVSPAATVPGVVADCGARGIRTAIVVSAGFREATGRDAGLERELRETAARHGVRFLGPNSLGVVRTANGFNALVMDAAPLPGRMALVSQSGALCTAILDWAGNRHIGFSSVIATGLGADIDMAETLDFLVRDAATDSILLYLEGVDDARRFMSALRAASRVKPVVVMKAGRHSGDPAATAFHTGSLVGADDVFDAAMRRAGVLRIRDFADLFAAAATLGAGTRVRGRRLAIVTNAGGPGIMAADHAIDRGLELAQLGATAHARLVELLPPGASTANPVYVRSDADVERFGVAAAACLEDPDVEVLLAIFTPHASLDAPAFADRLIDVAGAQRKPVFSCWMGGAAMLESRTRFAAARIATYGTPESAVDGIASLALYAANQEQLLQVPPPLAFASEPDLAAARQVIGAALAEGRPWLNPAESKAVLEAFGIPILRSVPARSPDEAAAVAEALGFPVALKILSPDVIHKTDVGGVRLGLASPAAVRRSYASVLEDVARVRPDARLEGVLIEPMYGEHGGRELMIGAVRDEVFGPAICFGLGGTLVEVIRDRAVALPPLNRFLAEDLIRRTRASRALQPLRGAPAADEAAVVEILLRVSDLVSELPELCEMDLNPVIASASGAVVVDARLGVRPPGRPSRQYRHMAIHPYPSSLEQEAVLRDGSAVVIRPIRPEDAAIEEAFVNGLSERSKFLRFMYTLHELSPQMLSRFTQIDYDREMALIAVSPTPAGELQVGVARYITLPDGETCEFAIVVGDSWQGHGLGSLLMTRLIDAARERDLRLMEGQTLRENAGMIELARSLGFAIAIDPDDAEVVRMRLPLQAPAAPA